MKEHVLSGFNASRAAILKSTIGMVVEKKKCSNWVPYQLKPKDVKQRFFASERLLQRQNRIRFLHHIVTGNEKWVHYDSLKRRKSCEMPRHASTSTARPNIYSAKVMFCIWWEHLSVAYYEPLKLSETITRDWYWTQSMRLSRSLKEKRPQYQETHDKVILQHDTAWPHVTRPVKAYLETLKWEVLLQPLYSPDIPPFDYHLFRSMTHGLAYLLATDSTLNHK